MRLSGQGPGLGGQAKLEDRRNQARNPGNEAARSKFVMKHRHVRENRPGVSMQRSNLGEQVTGCPKPGLDMPIWAGPQAAEVSAQM